MKNCIFCQIAQGNIPADIVYKDEKIVIFTDNQPQAPVHLLIIPRIHIVSLNDVLPDQWLLLSDMTKVAQQLATQQHFAQPGYRLVVNCGPDGGQAVFHLHMHLLSGRPMTWPPG